MAYREIGYDIDDIDEMLTDYLKKQKLTVKMDGKDIRLKVIVASPDEVYAKKTIPCLLVESGYTSETPLEWIKENEVSIISDTGGKNSYISEEIVTIYYTYKIGYYVTDPRHANAIFRALLSIFPTKFTLPLVKGDDEYCIAFLRESNVIKLDEVYDGVKVYRRDFIVQTTLSFGAYEYFDYLQAQGVIIEQIEV